MFGTTVFEGLRGYWDVDLGALLVFRLGDHLDRLVRSAKVMRLAVPLTRDAMAAAVADLVRANGLTQDVHIAVVVTEAGPIGTDPFLPLESVPQLHVTAVPVVPDRKAQAGVSVCVSSWRRTSDDMAPPRVKAGSNYGNLSLAHTEALTNGYDAPLLLNAAGNLSEGSGFSVFLLRGDRLVTPSVASGVLEGVTRATVIELARNELHIDVEERSVERSELYAADEIFLCGTMAEIIPVTSVDRLPVGDARTGPLAQRLCQMYADAVRARLPRFHHWSTAL